jgi:hypothetical protein
MNKTGQMPQMNVDIKATKALISPDGNHVFQEGVILRTVSKFISGTEQDGLIPVPCFYDVKTGKVLVEMLPKELRDEYTEYNETSK